MGFRLLVATVLVLAFAASAAAEEPLLANGAFAQEPGALPKGWTASEGARTGDLETRTRIEALEGGGVALAGGADTARWTMLSQRFEAKAGASFELAFTARAVGLALDRGQFGSCYVGFLLRDAGGGVQRFVVRDVRAPAWREERLYLHVPMGAASAEVALFLSQTGRLEVRKVALRRVPAAESYDVLVRDMDRNYSFFAPHGIDWQALAAPHAQAGRAAKTPADFVAAVRPLLAALADGHVWIQAPGGRREAPGQKRVTPNFDVQQVLARLTTRQQVIRNVLAGRTRDGYGYLALGTMQGTQADFAKVDRAWRDLFDAPALILDLRVDGGGQEAWGQRLCGCLATQRTRYGRSVRRGGPAHDDLVADPDRWVEPRTDAAYRKPVIALIGPGCVSSGEGMAMMLKALPGVTLVGLPTRGSSGNPAPIVLPNGVEVWYSRWISILPDGTPLERKGVPPDVRVEHAAGADPTFDKAVALLKARLAAGADAPK